MNEYEMMTVFHPRLNADETTAAIAALEEQIVANGGEMLSTDEWGRRRLAYPIDGVADGHYVLMTFNLPATGAAALERWIRISETTLRHLLIRGIIPFSGDRDGRDRDDRYGRDDRDDRDGRDGDGGGERGDRDGDDRDEDNRRGSDEPRAEASAPAPAAEAADAPAEASESESSEAEPSEAASSEDEA